MILKFFQNLITPKFTYYQIWYYSDYEPYSDFYVEETRSRIYALDRIDFLNKKHESKHYFMKVIDK